MSEDLFSHSFRYRWPEIVCQPWPQTPREQAQAKLERLDAELTQQQSRLLRLRKRIDKLHHRLQRGEIRLTMAAALVQKLPNSGGIVAEWEQQQHAVERLRERLQEGEVVYSRRLARLRKRKQERTELRVRLLCGSFPKPVGEESDPDYPF